MSLCKKNDIYIEATIYATPFIFCFGVAYVSLDHIIGNIKYYNFQWYNYYIVQINDLEIHARPINWNEGMMHLRECIKYPT
jgi:hypothetical protein